MNDNLLDSTRDLLSRYCESMEENDALTIILVSGETLRIKSAAAQDAPSMWFDLVDAGDNDISVRLDQIAAVRSEEGGLMPFGVL